MKYVKLWCVLFMLGIFGVDDVLIGVGILVVVLFVVLFNFNGQFKVMFDNLRIFNYDEVELGCEW